MNTKVNDMPMKMVATAGTAQWMLGLSEENGS
jgi:hypothetical protein